ncbi:toxin co-regulated pilus biosynthesis Q family protein [Achromobacter mucicolens]|uniref:TcpQ domain-containing protein n=1 Tax=Achromobacter TaxID=222 RepID=UPI0020A2DE26|nr:toxin co-regulated pilus biosynthesis Q family protein [Achromobacter mucicolens]
MPTNDVNESPQQVTPTAGAVVTVEVTPTEPVAEPQVVEPPKQIWRVSPQDGTVRQALVRWAADAHWTFGPDQWELNVDIPIQAPAEFEADSFREATQALSQAVAMGESPIRPCFYANRVLRMLPFTRSCNRSPATQS